MAQIAYILLCHKDTAGIIAQAQRLTAAGDCVAIHFDGRSGEADYRHLRAALDDNPAVVFTRRRLRCGWGEWSLVQATLEAVQAAITAFADATHFYMLSGDCMPIKSAEYAHAVLDHAPVDHIESFDFHAAGWIRTGIRQERLIYRHYFNERSQKRLFYAAIEVQRWLGLRARVPDDLQIQIGSQWWCLRRQTIERILDYCRAHPRVLRFFRRTWIPDETFFQTLVRHLVPEAEISSRPLTFLMFTDYGMPVTFYNDHHDLLLSQDYLFARKISPDAQELKARLGALYAATGQAFPISDEGRNLHRFLTGRGRVGTRFAPRFWETGSSLGRERLLLIVCCKKWHIGKRLVDRVQALTGIPALHYVFNEDGQLPDLGGIETGLDKRICHRRGFLRLLFDSMTTDRMALCLDPASLDVIEDLAADRATTRVLEIECSFSDAYLAGHARRLGLAGPQAAQDSLDRLLPVLRNDIRHESDRLRDAGFAGFARIREAAPAVENAGALAAFLGIPPDKALEIAATDHLFAD